METLNLIDVSDLVIGELRNFLLCHERDIAENREDFGQLQVVFHCYLSRPASIVEYLKRKEAIMANRFATEQQLESKRNEAAMDQYRQWASGAKRA